MRKILALGVALIGVSSAAHAQTTPSFDCSKASQWADLILCHDSALIQRDLDMAAALNDIYGKLPAPDAAAQRLKQAEWLNGRESCRAMSAQDGISPRDCLISVYDARMEALRKMASVMAPAAPPVMPQPAMPVSKTEPAKQVAAAPAVPQKEEIRFLQQNRIESTPSAIDPTRPREQVMVRESEPAVIPGAVLVSPVMDECKQEASMQGNLSDCLAHRLEQSDVDMQMLVSRVELKLRETGTPRTTGDIVDRFDVAQKAFETYREAHCSWKGAVTGDQSFYQACYTDLTRERAGELSAVLKGMSHV